MKDDRPDDKSAVGGPLDRSDPIDPNALRSGDSAALEAFYRAHARTVLDWVRRLGGPWLDSEDVAHDVFAVAFDRLHTYRDGHSTGAWLFGITRRVVANARRRAAFRRFIGLDSVPEPPTPGPDAEEELARLWRRRRVQMALETLTQNHREAVVLMDLEERTAPEVAEMLGISIGTVYSRLHYGRKAFAAAMEAELESSPAHWSGVLAMEQLR